MVGSIIKSNELTYPDAEYFFSPHEKYPEYRFNHLSKKVNRVYCAVRQALAQAGLDKQHYGEAGWNPLGEYIRKGDDVFILCNFVQEKRTNESYYDFFAKCTHASVIRAVVDYVLIAVGNTGKVTIGNAPLQSCDFKKVIKDTRTDIVLDFYKANNLILTVKDLRLLNVRRTRFGSIKFLAEKNQQDYVSINIGEKSKLNEIYLKH